MPRKTPTAVCCDCNGPPVVGYGPAVPAVRQPRVRNDTPYACIKCGADRRSARSGGCRVGMCWACRYGTRPNGDLALWVPTDAAPGSEEKLSVLAERVRMGLPLHHPRDARITREAS